MDACAKCQKKLGWLEKHDINGSRIDTAYPDYKGKKLCNPCKAELIAKIDKDRVELAEQKQKEAYENPFTLAEAQGLRTVIITDNIDQSVEHTLSERTKVAEQFGFLLKQSSPNELSVTMIFEKKEKGQAQIILDFSSLKDALSKGGVVMTAYNCPKCNAMVDLPEAGKVLICKYCGTPIKPVDIFEKIKSLL